MGEHRGGTDSVHEVRLESAIQQASWHPRVASVGSDVDLEVRTHFVGDGAKVRFEVRTRSGKTAGTADGRVMQGAGRGVFSVPTMSEEGLYFEAQLPDHGLKLRSDLLVVTPPRQFQNLQWGRQKAERGTEVLLRADGVGFPDDTEVRITISEVGPDDARDLMTEFGASVRGGKIEVPWTCNYFDPTHRMPTKWERSTEYRDVELVFRLRWAGVVAESGPMELRDVMEFGMADEWGDPTAGEEYVLYLPDGTDRKGQLNTKGRAREADLPLGPVRVEFPKLSRKA